jgi:AcrR family transcriptional regulator
MYILTMSTRVVPGPALAARRQISRENALDKLSRKAIRRAPASKPVRTARGRPRQPPALREARDALYREHVLEVAEGIFAEQGFASTRMQDIAKAAGISLGTLYQAYPGKAELCRAILITRDTEMLDAVIKAGQQVLLQPRSIEQLLGLMETQLSFMLEHPDYLRMQLQEGHVWYHSTAWPSQAEQQLWERGLKLMEQIFRWGMSNGLFIPGDPADQARMTLTLQQTRLANWVGAGMQEAHAAVIQRIQVDFVRNFCVPATVASLLTADGTCLKAAVHSRIRGR